MRLTYRKVANRDGSVTLETRPIARPIWRGFRVGVAAIFFVTTVGALVGHQWSTAGFALLVGAIALPKMRRRH